jgi:uncharacterized membrane protein YdjX (TVP38/TMEM64 family)
VDTTLEWNEDMINKRIVFLIYGVAIAAVITYRDVILSWLAQGEVERLPWMIVAAILLALVPVVPFGIIAGIIGAQYGPIWGSMINVASSTIAAAISFWAIRNLF